jgi:Ribbon-helix-helix protein, copG family
MSQQNKIHVPTKTAVALRQAALRRGTSISDVVQRLVATHLEAPTNSDCMVETNKRSGRVSACYLSNNLADAVRDLAAQNGYSQSWVIRDLLRSELRRRGLLPTSAAPAVEHTSAT